MNTFQVVIIAVFITAALIAVLIFAGVLPGFKNTGVENREIKITVWGVFNKSLMEQFFNSLSKENKKISFVYTEKKPENFEQELISAIANNEGPDLWFMSQDLILKHKKKTRGVPFASFPLRDFKNIYIDEAELFLDYQNENIIALPFALDPLIMYYNKDMLNAEFFTYPPKNWTEFTNFSKALVRKDEIGNIIQSGAALGEYRNIRHSKEILSALILQTGDKIVDNLKLTPDLRDGAASALRFYTDFANPKKQTYSWNNFLGDSLDNFLKGKLAFYFGTASEFKDIKQKNPNLNFDIALMPQFEKASKEAVFGKIWGIAVSNGSKNSSDLMYAAFLLSSYNYQQVFVKTFFLPSPRRDVLAKKTDDPYLTIFYKSALISAGWLDPGEKDTSLIFKNMIEFVNNKERDESQAARDAAGRLQNVIKKLSAANKQK